jgi:micrococcal nuclease
MRIFKPIFTILVLGLIIYGLYQFLVIPALFGGGAKLVSMIDPDTLLVKENGKLMFVQLIGADAPELTGPNKSRQCDDSRSLKLAADIFRTNRQISLSIDGKAGEKDDLGRNLRYVNLPDGTSYNGLLIKDGLAVESNPKNIDYKLKDEFLKDQEEAKSKGTGIWDANGCGGRF